MKDAGFHTVSSILMHTKKALCEVKGLSEPKIDKIRDAAIKIIGSGFITGTEARQKRMNVYNISTGSVALNDIIGGGIETGSITEAFGMCDIFSHISVSFKWCLSLSLTLRRRISMREDTAVAYALRDGAAADGYGWRKRTCGVYRYGKYVPSRANHGDMRAF